VINDGNNDIIELYRRLYLGYFVGRYPVSVEPFIMCEAIDQGRGHDIYY